MTFPFLSLDGGILTARLALLKHWTLQVSESYDRIMSRVERLEDSQKHQEHQAEHESQLLRIIELFMQDDVRACTVMDYIIVFFRLVLAKLRQRGQDFDDVKQLHKALADDEVAQIFRTTLSRLGFPATEQNAVWVILEVIQHRKWPTSQVMTTSPGGDAQISSALLYVRMQEDLESVMSSALQRALCAAHECILTDMAVSKATGHDVNINASDVRKDDAYVDARVKYEDYVSFDRSLAVENARAVLDTDNAGGVDRLQKEQEALGNSSDDSKRVEGVQDHDGMYGENKFMAEVQVPRKCYPGAPLSQRAGATETSLQAAKAMEECSVMEKCQDFSQTTAVAATTKVETFITAMTSENEERVRWELGEGTSQTKCQNVAETKMDTEQAADNKTENNRPEKMTPSPNVQTRMPLEENEGPTSIDHLKLARDPNFYVICYDVNTSSASGASTPEVEEKAAACERAHLRRRPGNHVYRPSSQSTLDIEEVTHDETGRE